MTFQIEMKFDRELEMLLASGFKTKTVRVKEGETICVDFDRKEVFLVPKNVQFN